MSNYLRRKSNKVRKKNQDNSWAYVILASIVDFIFTIPAPNDIDPDEPFFDLSKNLGELGQERQEKLFRFIATIVLGYSAYNIIRKYLKYGDFEKCRGSIVLAVVAGVFLLISIIVHRKKK